MLHEDNKGEIYDLYVQVRSYCPYEALVLWELLNDRFETIS